MALWKDRLEDDGAVHATETALRRVADAVVSDAVRALRRAFCAGGSKRQLETTLLLGARRHSSGPTSTAGRGAGSLRGNAGSCDGRC